jgi:hypothetical protein
MVVRSITLENNDGSRRVEILRTGFSVTVIGWLNPGTSIAKNIATTPHPGLAGAVEQAFDLLGEPPDDVARAKFYFHAMGIING